MNERRKGMEEVKENLSNIKTDIALLINQVGANHKYLREAITSQEINIERHRKILDGNGSEGIISKLLRIDENIENYKKDLLSHIVTDRWMIGIFVTVIIFVVGKLLKG